MREVFQRKISESNQDVFCGVDLVSCLMNNSREISLTLILCLGNEDVPPKE